MPLSFHQRVRLRRLTSSNLRLARKYLGSHATWMVQNIGRFYGDDAAATPDNNKV